MNPLQLRETVMNKDTRRMLRLHIEDDVETDEMLDMLLSKNVQVIEKRGWNLRVI